MGRRSEGPRLKWHRYGAAYYICWTEGGRSRERSTGTGNLEEAQEVFAEWLATRKPATNGPSDPDETLVTNVLADYALARGDKVIGKETLANNIATLASLLEGKTVVEVAGYTDTYMERRGVAPSTVRRELGVLRP
jgi:hypothetical protein